MMVVYLYMVEQNKYYGDHTERLHLTGEMEFAVLLNRLSLLDAKILQQAIIPVIPRSLALFFVGSLTDSTELTYHDVDVHLVPKNDCTHRQVMELQQECFLALQANPTLTTFLQEKGDIKLIFTGSLKSILGLHIPVWKSACFELLLPYPDILPAKERYQRERMSGKSFAYYQG